MSTPKNRDGNMQNCYWQLLESPVKKTRMLLKFSPRFIFHDLVRAKLVG
jgi:hypothetical protein